MSINLNDNKFAQPAIFNNGVAGLVEGVEITGIKPKGPEDHDRAPDYKVVYTDTAGGNIEQPFWYFSPREGASQDEIDSAINRELSRLISLARAVMGEDATLPEVTDVQNALDVVMKLVSTNTSGKKYNVFATYGTVNYPKQYIELRRFRFIEPADVEVSTLTKGANDQMSRVMADEPATTPANASSGWGE